MNNIYFRKHILNWYQRFGRKDLPWQINPNPYRVWVSEIMLQQTQVTTVIPYFERFMNEFPNIKQLAIANRDLVMQHWAGLGYYARARHLHDTAQIIHEKHRGRFPKTLIDLMALPGIGRSTAGAIMALAYEVPAPILDGNVKRVLTRVYAIAGFKDSPQVNEKLWTLATELTPRSRAREYTQAMMDLGATVCTRTKPKCDICPLQKGCKAHALGQETNFPQSKPRKQKPVKSCYLLIIENPKGQILLEKRPSTGIWSDLWCFPECTLDSDIGLWCKQHFGRRVIQTEWPSFRHTFTHYHLDITPIHIQLSTSGKNSLQSNTIWIEAGIPPSKGVSAPVKKLLQKLKTVEQIL